VVSNSGSPREQNAALAFTDALDQVQKLAGAAARPVKFGDQQHVAFLQRCHQLGQLRPIGPGPS
jgi:hypothetical protein